MIFFMVFRVSFIFSCSILCPTSGKQYHKTSCFLQNFFNFLTDISNSSRKFFVRVKGTPETELAKVQEVFGNVQPVVVADVDGEFGFVTEVMTEAEYKAKAESFGEVLGMIRVRRVED